MFEISPQDWTAVALSLRIAVVATMVSLPFGIAVATLLARKDFWGKTLVEALIYLPLVLPPVVTGCEVPLSVPNWCHRHLAEPERRTVLLIAPSSRRDSPESAASQEEKTILSDDSESRSRSTKVPVTGTVRKS